jgi:hypothetical protein
MKENKIHFWLGLLTGNGEGMEANTTKGPKAWLSFSPHSVCLQ